MWNAINFQSFWTKESRNREKYWKRWGCYLSERAWGTVREDYSADGSAWDYFPFEQANKKAFRWNEDGIAGICDRKQRICFSLTLWNGKDEILKERLFGLAGPQGNHGEDVKEYYYYLDSTPTHSYMKYLYKYPQTAFPYRQLKVENARRDKTQPEFELIDTGVFADNKLIATTLNLACPSQEVEGGSAVNADFWHQVRESLRATHGDDLHVLAHPNELGDVLQRHVAALAGIVELTIRVALDDTRGADDGLVHSDS